MMLGGWLNAVACVLKKRIRHLSFQPIWRPRFDPVSSLIRPANPDLAHQLEPASIPTVNQPRTGKTPISSLGANARHIAWLGGLKLTATGNLARAVVDDMRDRFEWPGYEKASTLALYKVVNEPGFMPLHFIRITAAHAGLLRRRKGALTTTPAARELLSQQRFGPLQAILFHTALWHLDLSYFGRGLLGSWPQGDIGIVLWSLTVAAWDWQTPERLSRLCAVPTAEVVEPGIWDRGSLAFEARVLRPLFWFGLLERSAEKSQTHELVETHLYRKSSLFDRFLKFDVGIAAYTGAGSA